MAIITGYHGHSDKASKKFGKGDWFLGFELEVECPFDADKTADATEFDRLTPSTRIFFERDGSLSNGYEIISAPMTVRHFVSHQDEFRAALNYLVSKGYKSHDTNTCGLHIHVSREAFGLTETERESSLTKVLYMVEKFWPDFVKLARRDSSWARRPMTDTLAKAESKAKGYIAASHSDAVNLSNAATVEFRLCKGTLKADTLFATVELIARIVKVANWVPAARIQSAKNLKGLLWSIPSVRDQYLAEYMVERSVEQ